MLLVFLMHKVFTVIYHENTEQYCSIFQILNRMTIKWNKNSYVRVLCC